MVSDDLELVQANKTAARYHEVEIYRGIRVVKERSRSVIVNLTFASLKKQIVIHLIYFLVLCLNAFLYIQGVYF